MKKTPYFQKSLSNNARSVVNWLLLPLRNMNGAPACITCWKHERRVLKFYWNQAAEESLVLLNCFKLPQHVSFESIKMCTVKTWKVFRAVCTTQFVNIPHLLSLKLLYLSGAYVVRSYCIPGRYSFPFGIHVRVCPTETCTVHLFYWVKSAATSSSVA